MKKSDFRAGFLMALAGILCLAAALVWDTPLGSLLWGFFGAFGAGGAVQLCKYFKWSRPRNAEAYRRRLEEEQINMEDERKAMLRDKSGRYAYILGMLVAAAAELACAVLWQLGIISRDAGRTMSIFLGLYALFQYAAGLVIYRMLSRKY